MTAPKADELADLETFYVAVSPRLVAGLTLIAGSRDVAEDVVQDAFARLIPRWPQVRQFEVPEAWVRLVALRLLRTRLKTERRRKTTASGLDPQDRRSVSEAEGARLDVHSALLKLSLPLREVAVLFYVYDLSVIEIAEHLRVPVGTVKSRLSRGRDFLAASTHLGVYRV